MDFAFFYGGERDCVLPKPIIHFFMVYTFGKRGCVLKEYIVIRGSEFV